MAALGSEDWCDAIHAGVVSDGRPSVHGVDSELPLLRLHRFCDCVCVHRFWARSARRHLSSGQEVTRGRCHPCRFCPVRCHEGHARVSAAQAANSWSWALPPRRSATWSRVAAGHLHDLASQRLASTQERVGSSTASGDVDRTPPRARVSAASQRISALWRDSCVLVGAGRAVGCRRRAGGVGGAQEGPLDEI